MKAMASFIMQGGRQATIIVATMAILSLIVPPVVIISTAAVCLVTLRCGLAEGLRVIVGSTVATALLAYLVMSTPMVAVSYLCVLWLPALLAACVLRQSRQLAKAIEALVGLGMLAVISIYLFVDNPAQQWMEAMTGVLNIVAQQQKLPVSQAELEQAIVFWSQYVTGLVVAGTVVSLTLSLFLARWWQGELYNPGGFYDEFKRLSLLKRDGVIFLVLLAIAVLMSGQLAEIAWNLNVQILMLFLMIGTSVVHVVVKSRTNNKYLLFGIYVVFFFGTTSDCTNCIDWLVGCVDELARTTSW